MSRQLPELENVLQLLIDEHLKMLELFDLQQKAMKKLSLDDMEECQRRQESIRLRIVGLESRRRAMVQQFARLARLQSTATLAQVADAFPPSKTRLLHLRDELKNVIRQITDRTTVGGRLASAVLGHLNTAMRLFAGAVGQTGVYTKTGVPKVSARIGVMEAVG